MLAFLVTLIKVIAPWVAAAVVIHYLNVYNEKKHPEFYNLDDKKTPAASTPFFANLRTAASLSSRICFIVSIISGDFCVFALQVAKLQKMHEIVTSLRIKYTLAWGMQIKLAIFAL